MAQGGHGIDPAGSAGGKVAGQEDGKANRDCGNRKGSEIQRAHPRHQVPQQKRAAKGYGKSHRRTGQPEPEVRTLTGWRREVVGNELLALLRGERAIAIAADGRLNISQPTDVT